MSLGYQPVLWNRQKKRYDLILWVFIVTYLVLFGLISSITNPEITEETFIIRSTGTLAIFLLHVILSIGPLARINTKFLPLLYNRRHLGVSMFLIAAIHGVFSILNFHSLSNVNPLVSLFGSNTDYLSLLDFPFQVLGFIALNILFLMAVTSHDFWLNLLTPKIWKSLHMMVYIAYALLVFHVVLGALQNEKSVILYLLIGGGFVWIIVLHLWSARKELKFDKETNSSGEDYVYAGDLSEIANNRAKILSLNGERVAIFKYEGKLSAVSNVCCHQNGPLGEGKIMDGLITCPWHGYQYQPHDGCAPAPFTEKVSTFKLKLDGEKIFIDPTVQPAGTPVEPLTFSHDG